MFTHNCCYKKGDQGRKYKKMAESMGGKKKRSYY